MGNLLGAPVTDKETHRGVTKDEQLKFGLSSMQGWRVHMEDAHIAEGELYALEANGIKIPLLGHALFAVYDGHGGTFAAIYSGSNFLRILSKQSKFVQYAKMCAASDNNRADKMRVLEQALQQAFVETDYEIGLAIRGKSHADANSPYHAATVSAPAPAATSIDSVPSDESSEDDATNNHYQQSHTTPNSNPAMAGAAMKAASDHLSAIEDEGDSGTTSVVVMITPDSIVCANAGDSRAVFARRPEALLINNSSSDNDSLKLNDSTDSGLATTVGKAIPLSFDHKPDDEEEEKRVRNAGGYVTGGRVEGDLAVSRGLGDFRFKQMSIVLNNTQLYPEEENNAATTTTTKETSTPANAPTDMATDDEDDDDEQKNQSIPLNDSLQRKPLEFPPGDQKVSPIPDVTIHMRNHERDEYVVVACDGIWDVVSNQQCILELDEIMYAEGERDLGLVSEEVRIYFLF
jgi:serine/threonine protein phosphatase PrpC